MNPKNNKNKIKILLIEDNPDHRILISDEIESYGDNYLIDEADSDKEGLDKLKDNTYDIILLDYTLPKMNGLEVLTLINEKYDIPVIMITGMGNEQISVNAMKRGAYDYISKDKITSTPFDRLINNVLDRHNLLKEKRKTEDKLERYNFIINTAEEFMTLINRDYKYEAVNEAYCKAHNKKYENIINKSVPDIWGKDNYENNIKMYIDKCFAGEIVNYQFESNFGLLKDRWIDVKYYPFYNEKKEITHAVVVSRDITDKVEKDKALDKAMRNLKDAYSELKDKSVELIQSEKLSTLGEVASGLCHELNQPLNVITVICQTILRDIDKNRFNQKSAATDIPEIIKQINKMSTLIDHMRIYVHASKDVKLTNEKLSINNIINDSLVFVKQQLKNHNINLTIKLEPKMLPMCGNHLRLEQVIINLINNARFAVDKSKKEEKDICVKTYNTKNNKEIVIEIKDNGIGISEDQKKKIFDAFFTTKNKGEGTGLGLSISSKIVKEYKGRIEVMSKINEGSIFKIIFPVMEK